MKLAMIVTTLMALVYSSHFYKESVINYSHNCNNNEPNLSHYQKSHKFCGI